MHNYLLDSEVREKFIQGIEDCPVVRIRVKGTLLVTYSMEQSSS
jgi:hypothetical protein